MPFIPHTPADVENMLATLGANSIEDLFDEIPAELKQAKLSGVPTRMSEQEITRLMTERAMQDGLPLCFVGAGAYEHHIPAAVWEVTTRGEFYSAYTPYQAEASQGTLQLLYEYQTMMASLTGMDVSNASLYDGASAAAEAVLMAVRSNRKSTSKRVLVPRNTHPAYRKTIHAIVANQGITLEEIDFDPASGQLTLNLLPANPGDFAALLIAQPNFFGVLEEVDALTDWAHQHGALVVAVVNPLSLAIVTPPGEWGAKGADIVCGDGQPLGIPLSSGGPYFGFCCCKEELVRQMPGRIVGRTVDLDGKPGFTLTLQAREQHIRRSKATSNICTNQGLLVTAATIYMAIVGDRGLEQTALNSHANTRRLADKLAAMGVKTRFTGAYFHELVLTLNKPAESVLEKLAQANIVGGYALAANYPELGNALLVCATETKTEADLDSYCAALAKALS